MSFTGSVDTGRHIAQKCAARLAKFQLEMGSKNRSWCSTTPTLEVAVGCAINGAFFQTGQRCTASSRLIVTEQIHDRFVAALIEGMEKLKVDHALKPGTRSARWSTRSSSTRTSYLEIGQKEAAGSPSAASA